MSLSRKLIFLFFFIYLFLGCRKTEKISHHPLESLGIPFYLDFDRLSVPTSDSLLAKNQKARMFVTIYQNNEAKILGFHINAFRLGEGEKLLYNFEDNHEVYQPKSIAEVNKMIHPKEYYPAKLQPFYLALKNYLEELKFTKATTITPQKFNIAGFVFRFGENEKQPE